MIKVIVLFSVWKLRFCNCYWHDYFNQTFHWNSLFKFIIHIAKQFHSCYSNQKRGSLWLHFVSLIIWMVLRFFQEFLFIYHWRSFHFKVSLNIFFCRCHRVSKYPICKEKKSIAFKQVNSSQVNVNLVKQIWKNLKLWADPKVYICSIQKEISENEAIQ